ncbi:5-amino-6-(5-phospho-D-ribitylamino)uracil phosphatase, chloroplastic-like [Phragmites australis]|uniref:5-amino-6-(5-phospho-D-ribitylamino)uracil phosphatase, chloroplastic-like n=1 Tax=Phragmites australis TaxID=29695 RepID=UPI002D77494E|nr:5-amino-6-(5-phospho-D-ribitylamino)uracil phosphatase, chloroplastic-like [Phragmites australis]
MMVVDTVSASTSIIAPHLVDQRYRGSHHHLRRTLHVVACRPLATAFAGRRLVARVTRQPPHRLADWPVKALAMGVTKEASPRREYRGIPGDGGDMDGIGTMNPATSWPPRNRADDPKLHNPLLRLQQMGCGWLGVIFEWEGVIVEDDAELERQAWLTLAQEEGKSPPLAFVLKRIEGMKNEQAISEVLCWSRVPSELTRLASRKEEIRCSLRGRAFYQMRNGSREFMSTLANYKIPLAVVSTRPRKVIEEAIEAVGVRSFFDVVVAAEDVYRGKPDPEMFLYAAQLLSFIPERCVVFGNSNSAVEAAHDARMKCVAVASKHKIYELSAADLVVKQLNELSVVDLKNLADIESPEFGMEPEPELEEEEETSPPSSSVGVDDLFW